MIRRVEGAKGRRVIAMGLAIVLVAVSALMYPATVPHAAHHAAHNATTHGSVLCTWLCSAGQAAEFSLGSPSAVFARSEPSPVPQIASFDRVVSVFSSSRAPPAITT